MRQTNLFAAVHTHKATARSTIADIQKRITRLQVEYGLRPYNVTTFEARVQLLTYGPAPRLTSAPNGAQPGTA